MPDGPPTARMPASVGQGLTEREAARRIALRGEVEPRSTSRSTRSIVRSNIFTPFNLILVVFGLLTLGAGDWRDALFLIILVGNSGLGILQELRAKKALDRLAALVTPHANVIRDGNTHRVAVEDVFVGDLVALAPGDQVVADGDIVRSQGLALDESVLTGESLAVPRDVGESVRAGAFVSEGSGTFVATAVGDDSYAQKIAGEAREFRHARSPLEQAIDKLLLITAAAMVPLGIAFGVALTRQDIPFREALSEATAGVVTLVPEGLILLVSLTYAVAALRMTRRGALAQQLSAIEALSGSDVVCLDKTGTLTEDTLRLVELVPATGLDEGSLAEAASLYAASSGESDPLLAAILVEHPAQAGVVGNVVPFSSRRRWSGQVIGGRTLVLGSPDLILAPDDELAERAQAEGAKGRRVVALAEAPRGLGMPGPDDPPPADLIPIGLVVLAEQLRPSTVETVRFLREEGVRLVVISGDAPATVAAIADDAGIGIGGPPVDGRHLPDDPTELREAVLAAGVCGRVSPDGKRRIVQCLSDAGLGVTMVGDGVNDVPALKAARVALVPGSAADMARSIADIVLVKGGFEAVPPMIAEGRKLLRNLQRVAKLFVTKAVIAAFLILTVGLSPTSYPFLPRHLTLVSTLCIGIPAFVLALAPSSGEWRTHGFLRDVARFSVPAGVASGLGVVAAFLIGLNVIGMPLEEARTVAVAALTLIGFYLVLVLEASNRSRARLVAIMCGALLAVFVAILATSGTREFFDLTTLGVDGVFAALIGTGLTVSGLWITDERFALPWNFALRFRP